MLLDCILKVILSVMSRLFVSERTKCILTVLPILLAIVVQSAPINAFGMTPPFTWKTDTLKANALVAKKKIGPAGADTTLAHYEQALKVAKKKNKNNLIAKANFELANYYNRHAERANGLRYLEQALLSQYPLIDSLTIAIRIQQANIYIDNTNYEKGIEVALKAQLLCEKLKMQNSISMYKVYNALGRLYNNSQNKNQAMVYSIKGRELAQRIDYKKGMLYSLLNLSSLYVQFGDKKQALETISEALILAQKLNDVETIGRCLSSMGTIKKAMKQYDAALADFLQALAIKRRLDNNRELSVVNYNLASLYHDRKDNITAISYLNESIRLASQTKYAAYMVIALKLKAAIYRDQKNFQEAFDQLTVYAKLRDSILSSESINAVARAQANFDFERKESQIQLLRKNLIIQSLQITRKQGQLAILNQQKRVNELRNRLLFNEEQLAKSDLKLQKAVSANQQIIIHKQQGSIQKAYHEQALLFVILLLLMVLILVTYLAMRQQDKIRRTLLVKKNQITRQAQQLTFLNATKDKLFSIVSHDLRAPAAQLKNDLLKLRLGGDLTNFSETLHNLERQADTLLDLLTNLLEWSYSQLNGFKTVLQPTDISDVMLEVVQAVNDQLSEKKIILINQFPRRMLALADKRQLAVILRNLLSNSIKFTPSEGYIRLVVRETSETIDLQIRDTGIGMNTQQVTQLFLRPQIRTGTHGESGTGLGLRLCQDLTTNLGGTLRIDSQPGGGTTAMLTLRKFPISTESRSSEMVQ